MSPSVCPPLLHAPARFIRDPACVNKEVQTNAEHLPSRCCTPSQASSQKAPQNIQKAVYNSEREGCSYCLCGPFSTGLGDIHAANTAAEQHGCLAARLRAEGQQEAVEVLQHHFPTTPLSPLLNASFGVLQKLITPPSYRNLKGVPLLISCPPCLRRSWQSRHPSKTSSGFWISQDFPELWSCTRHSLQASWSPHNLLDPAFVPWHTTSPPACTRQSGWRRSQWHLQDPGSHHACIARQFQRWWRVNRSTLTLKREWYCEARGVQGKIDPLQVAGTVFQQTSVFPLIRSTFLICKQPGAVPRNCL